jgi:hypothetical protein
MENESITPEQTICSSCINNCQSDIPEEAGIKDLDATAEKINHHIPNLSEIFKDFDVVDLDELLTEINEQLKSDKFNWFEKARLKYLRMEILEFPEVRIGVNNENLYLHSDFLEEEDEKKYWKKIDEDYFIFTGSIYNFALTMTAYGVNIEERENEIIEIIRDTKVDDGFGLSPKDDDEGIWCHIMVKQPKIVGKLKEIKRRIKMAAHSSYNKETATCDSYLPNCVNYTMESIRATKEYLRDETLNIKHLNICVEDWGNKYNAETMMNSFANEIEELEKEHNRKIFEYGKKEYIEKGLHNYYNLYEFIVWLQKQGFNNATLVEEKHEATEMSPNGWTTTYIKGDRK